MLGPAEGKLAATCQGQPAAPTKAGAAFEFAKLPEAREREKTSLATGANRAKPAEAQREDMKRNATRSDPIRSESNRAGSYSRAQRPKQRSNPIESDQQCLASWLPTQTEAPSSRRAPTNALLTSALQCEVSVGRACPGCLRPTRADLNKNSEWLLVALLCACCDNIILKAARAPIGWLSSRRKKSGRRGSQ